MKKPKIILVGGGGHCKSCIDIIETENKYKIKGIIDLPNKLGSSILGYKVFGSDDDLLQLVDEGNSFLITIGHLGNSIQRDKLFQLLNKNKGNLPVIKSPVARISQYSTIGKGTIIMHNCILNSDTKIGDNCIINNKALIEHDVVIGSNCHISTDANINGGCVISDNVFIGSSATLLEGIFVQKGTLIGAGSVVIKSIKETGIYYGNPAIKMREHQ